MCCSFFTSYRGRKKVSFYVCSQVVFFFKFSSSYYLFSNKAFLLSKTQEGLLAEWSPEKKDPFKGLLDYLKLNQHSSYCHLVMIYCNDNKFHIEVLSSVSLKMFLIEYIVSLLSDAYPKTGSAMKKQKW